MSGIAKIFVIINLVLAVMFTGFTLALYANRVKYKSQWLAEVESHKETKATFSKKVAKLEADLKTTEENLRTAQRSVKELEDRVAEMQTAVQSKEARIVELEADNSFLLQKIDAQDKELKRRHETIVELHKRITNQQQLLEQAIQKETAAIRMRIEAENQLKAAREHLATALKEKERVESDLAHAKWMLDMIQERLHVDIGEVFGAGGGKPIPAIDAQVLAVDPETNLVMLSVGKDDDVEKGFVFSVYRNDKFIGKVRVVRVLQDMSAAVILQEFHGKEDIQEGDHASTRLF